MSPIISNCRSTATCICSLSSSVCALVLAMFDTVRCRVLGCESDCESDWQRCVRKQKKTTGTVRERQLVTTMTNDSSANRTGPAKVCSLTFKTPCVCNALDHTIYKLCQACFSFIRTNSDCANSCACKHKPLNRKKLTSCIQSALVVLSSCDYR